MITIIKQIEINAKAKVFITLKCKVYEKAIISYTFF